jgi:TolB-like protein
MSCRSDTTRRATRLCGTVLAGLALALLCLPSLAGPASAQTAPAATTATDKPRLVVLELSTRGEAQADTAEYLAELLRTGARATLGNAVLVMTRESMLSLVPAHELVGASEASGEVEAGQRLGARYVLAGQLVEVEGLYRLVVKLFDTRAGDLLHGATFKAATAAELVERVEVGAGAVYEALWPKCPPGMRYDVSREGCLDPQSARCPPGTRYVRNQGCLAGDAPPAPPTLRAPAPVSLSGGAAGLLAGQARVPEATLHALRQVEPELRRCAERFSGLVRVELRVSGSAGRVASAYVTGPDRITADCMARALRKAQFPAVGTPSYTVNHEFRF